MRIKKDMLIIEHDNLDYEIIARNFAKWHELCTNVIMFEDDLQLRFVKVGLITDWVAFYSDILDHVDQYHKNFNSKGKLIQIGDPDDNLIDIHLERTVSDIKQYWHNKVNIHIATGHGLGIEIVRLTRDDLIKLGRELLAYANEII